jgi:hypothetical protein
VFCKPNECGEKILEILNKNYWQYSRIIVY